MLIRFVDKPGALNGESWFGVPRLRGLQITANRLKGGLQTIQSAVAASLCRRTPKKETKHANLHCFAQVDGEGDCWS